MTLDAALRHAIRHAPFSVRALARAASLSHTMLTAIVSGRERATARVAKQVIGALEAWGTRCHNEAARVRTAVKRHQPRRRA